MAKLCLSFSHPATISLVLFLLLATLGTWAHNGQPSKKIFVNYNGSSNFHNALYTNNCYLVPIQQAPYKLYYHKLLKYNIGHNFQCARKKIGLKFWYTDYNSQIDFLNYNQLLAEIAGVNTYKNRRKLLPLRELLTKRYATLEIILNPYSWLLSNFKILQLKNQLNMTENKAQHDKHLNDIRYQQDKASEIDDTMKLDTNYSNINKKRGLDDSTSDDEKDHQSAAPTSNTMEDSNCRDDDHMDEEVLFCDSDNSQQNSAPQGTHASHEQFKYTPWTWTLAFSIHAELSNYAPVLPELESLREVMGATDLLQDADAEHIIIARDSRHLPITLARIQYREWIDVKLGQRMETDEVTTVESDIILKFMAILLAENHMQIYSCMTTDYREIIDTLNPPEQAQQRLRMYYEERERSLHQELELLMANTLQLLPAHVDQTKVTEGIGSSTSHATLQLHQLLLKDSGTVEPPRQPPFAATTDCPIAGKRPPQPVMMNVADLPRFNSPPVNNAKASFPSTTPLPEHEILAIELLDQPLGESAALQQTVESMKHVAQTIATNLRTWHQEGEVPKGSDITKMIQSRCLSDRHVYWAGYVTISGFLPAKTAEESLLELRNSFTLDGNGLEPDASYVMEMHTSNGWAITRNHEALGNIAGYIVKLARPVLAANFRAVNGYEATVPAICVVNGTRHRKRQYIISLQPTTLNPRHIQLPRKYPALMVARKFPIFKDLHALTAGAIATLHRVVDSFLDGKFVLLPQIVYTSAISEWTKVNGINVETLYHPCLQDLPKGGERKSFAELVVEVIFTGVEDDIDDGAQSKVFLETSEAVFTHLKEQNPHEDHHFLYRYGGFTMEIFRSFRACLEYPRRHARALAEWCVMIHELPANILMEEVFGILAKDERNIGVIQAASAGIVLPCVPKARLSWRAVILGISNAKYLNLGPLREAMESRGYSILAESKNPLIPGYEQYHKLQSMLEVYYARRDRIISPLPSRSEATYAEAVRVGPPRVSRTITPRESGRPQPNIAPQLRQSLGIDSMERTSAQSLVPSQLLQLNRSPSSTPTVNLIRGRHANSLHTTKLTPPGGHLSVISETDVASTDMLIAVTGGGPPHTLPVDSSDIRPRWEQSENFMSAIRNLVLEEIQGINADTQRKLASQEAVILAQGTQLEALQRELSQERSQANSRHREGIYATRLAAYSLLLNDLHKLLRKTRKKRTAGEDVTDESHCIIRDHAALTKEVLSLARLHADCTAVTPSSASSLETLPLPESPPDIADFRSGQA